MEHDSEEKEESLSFGEEEPSNEEKADKVQRALRKFHASYNPTIANLMFEYTDDCAFV